MLPIVVMVTDVLVHEPDESGLSSTTFEVLIAGKPQSAALADRVKSLDWRSRKATKKGAAAADELADVRAKILALIG